jgi:flagellar assembly factor FliW
VIEPTQDEKKEAPMMVKSTRFGTVDCPTQNLIHFPDGLIGLPCERDFAFLGHGDSEQIAWLQSVTAPDVAIPVVSAHSFEPLYPDFSLEDLAKRVGLEENIDQLLVAVVLTANAGEVSTVNLMAPVVIDPEARVGAQVIVADTRFSTRELYSLPNARPAEEVTADAPLAAPTSRANGPSPERTAPVAAQAVD